MAHEWFYPALVVRIGWMAAGVSGRRR